MGLCIFFDLIYIKCYEKNKYFIGLFAKVIAAFCFITIGYMAYLDKNSLFYHYILLGLIFGGIGDLFLALKNLIAKNVMFIIGTISFLVGHILYLRALFLLDNYYLVDCLIGGVLFGTITFSFLDKICRLNKYFKVIGIVYMMMISIMVAMSIGAYLSNPNISNVIFMIGAILFVSSDIILSIYNFSKKEKWMHPVYSLLYFIAQILISFSLHI